MAKKTKAKTRAKAGLVGTQQAAIEKMTTKRDLSGLAVKLAARHGTSEQQALKRSDIASLKRAEIRALVAELATRAHQRKKVHLSELGGWPVCWPSEKRDKVKPDELLTTPISVQADSVTCSRCQSSAQLPSPEETAAFKRAEVEAAKSQKRKRKEASEGRTASGRTKRKLKLKTNLPVRLKIKDLEVKGVLRPDGTMSVKRKSYPSPHAAANELAGDLVAYRIDGFQAWRYQDEDGKWRMLRDHGQQ